MKIVIHSRGLNPVKRFKRTLGIIDETLGELYKLSRSLKLLDLTKAVFVFGDVARSSDKITIRLYANATEEFIDIFIDHLIDVFPEEGALDIIENLPPIGGRNGLTTGQFIGASSIKENDIVRLVN